MLTVGIVIAWVLQIYFYILLARAILSWVPLISPSFQPKGALLVIFEVVYSLTDPPMNLARRWLPNGPTFGGIRLDLGFLVVLIALLVLMQLNRIIFLS